MNLDRLKQRRPNRIWLGLGAATAILLLKVFLSILAEYPRYFPADFESAFLSGRRYLFSGTYRFAFYVHILSSPLAVLLGTWLVFSGGKRRLTRWHRWSGRLQFLVVTVGVVPSGIMMARSAYAGPIAAAGFYGLSIATFLTMSLACGLAMRGKFAQHRRWALRNYVLLCSPLFLRIMNGAIIQADMESEWSYRLVAWGSWMLPWLGLELLLVLKRRRLRGPVINK